jgi:hypothetical protein
MRLLIVIAFHTPQGIHTKLQHTMASISGSRGVAPNQCDPLNHLVRRRRAGQRAPHLQHCCNAAGYRHLRPVGHTRERYGADV